MIPVQGDIWWADSPEKRRPVLVVTRTIAIPVLHTILVAPITRSVRGIPTEVPLGTRHGLAGPSVAAFDNLLAIPRSLLTERVGWLAADQAHEICRAMDALTDC